MTDLILRRTRPDDLDYVVDAESDPEAGRWVTGWSRDRHAASLTNPDHHHVVVEYQGRRVGWALLAGLEDTNRSVELKRIIMTERGRGLGTRALRLLVDLAFDEHEAHRVWLDVKADNDRAKRIYERFGFVVEGRMRDAFRTPTGYDTLILMSMLEDERGVEGP